jgi:hypothetical protein
MLDADSKFVRKLISSFCKHKKCDKIDLNVEKVVIS